MTKDSKFSIISFAVYVYWLFLYMTTLPKPKLNTKENVFLLNSMENRFSIMFVEAQQYLQIAFIIKCVPTAL